MLALTTGVAQLGNSGRRIAQQSFTECGIHPGARDDVRAVARTDFRLVSVDQYIECCRIDISVLGQYRLERPDAPFDVTEITVIFRQGVLLAATGRYSWKLLGLATNSRLLPYCSARRSSACRRGDGRAYSPIRVRTNWAGLPTK